MPSDALPSALTALRARLQAELDAQLAALQADIDAGHGAAGRAATHAAVADLERAWARTLGALSQDTVRALADPKKAGGTSASAKADQTPADPPHALLQRLARTMRTLSEASSLTATLDALADGAVLEAPRTALFLVTGADEHTVSLERWASGGFADSDAPPNRTTVSGELAEAVRSCRPCSSPVPSKAPWSRTPIAWHLMVPVVVGDRAVAVLYAEADAAGIRPEVLLILGQHASLCLSHVTSLRMAQVAGVAPAAADDDDSARRYARLLVSEIKLYNESAVRTGRERRDLLARLRPEIDRARRLYDARVALSSGARATVFQQELVQTLAEGDPRLLGASA